MKKLLTGIIAAALVLTVITSVSVVPTTTTSVASESTVSPNSIPGLGWDAPAL